ncbi:MAG: recombinase family protein [Anaerolineae bacterium]|nr:recombinase family protein [Anaerolineae bacterium]
MNKRAILYARVSTDEQAEKGYSLPTQLEACRNYADNNGFDVLGEIQDNYSGAKLDRPGLDELRERLKNGDIDAVIVYSADRWTRNLVHSLLLREELQQVNVELHFVNRGKTENTPEGRMMDNIEGVFAEYWREKIIEASRRGKWAKARAGKVVGSGRPLYGYRYEDGELVIYEPEANAVRLMYDLYTVGDGNGPLAVYAIAIHMSKSGYPTPAESMGLRVPRRRAPGIWGEVIIHKILANETYCGIWRFGKHIGSNGKKRPVEEQVEVFVPAIVSREIWEAAQERRAYNKKMAARNTKREYLLRGHIICGACGSAMVGGAGIRYLCCRHSNRYRELEYVCSQKSVKSALVDNIVWRYVLDILTEDADQFENDLRAAQAAEQESLATTQERLEILDRLLTRCESDAANLVNTLSGLVTSGDLTADGVMSKVIQERAAALDKQHEALVYERTELQETLQNQHFTDADIAAAMQFRQDVVTGMKEPTFEDKRAIIEILDIRATVMNGIIRVNCYLKTDSSIELPISAK